MSEQIEPAILHDIFAATERMLRFVEGVEKQQFLQNDEKCYAVLAQLIIIGEAANRLPDSFHEANPSVPWRQMIGMRNRVVHGYDAVDWNIVWDVAAKHGPELKKSIAGLL
jgi:uncharacterized protein with HEPN domain